MGKNLSALISGFVLIVIGVVLLFLGLFKIKDFGGVVVLDLYGLIALGVGIAILLLRKKEDEIEQIRKKK